MGGYDLGSGQMITNGVITAAAESAVVWWLRSRSRTWNWNAWDNGDQWSTMRHGSKRRFLLVIVDNPKLTHESSLIICHSRVEERRVGPALNEPRTAVEREPNFRKSVRFASNTRCTTDEQWSEVCGQGKGKFEINSMASIRKQTRGDEFIWARAAVQLQFQWLSIQ